MPFTKRAQNSTTKMHFANFFVSKTMHRFTHFLEMKFPEISKQNMNRYGHEYFQNRISKFF